MQIGTLLQIEPAVTAGNLTDDWIGAHIVFNVYLLP